MVVLTSKKREEQLAINLFDLIHRLEHGFIVPELIAGKLDPSRALEMKIDRAKPDDRGVVFRCPLLLAATICDIIRSGDRKRGVENCRMYIRREQWSKVWDDVIFTLPCFHSKGLRLNPEVFASAEAPKGAIPLPPKRLF